MAASTARSRPTTPGPVAVEKYRGVPPYRETVLYIQKIVRDSGLGAERTKALAESATGWR